MGISTMISVNRKADVRSEAGRMTRARAREPYVLSPIMSGQGMVSELIIFDSADCRCSLIVACLTFISRAISL